MLATRSICISRGKKIMKRVKFKMDRKRWVMEVAKPFFFPKAREKIT